jgi:hypothetical protein
MHPGRRYGIRFKRLERHGAQDLIEIGTKQRIENLSLACIMDRERLQAGLQQRQHSPFVQAPSHRIEGVMPIENGQDQGFDPTAAGQDMGRIRGDHRLDKLGHLKFASHPQHQRQMGEGRQATNGNRHDEPP